MKNNIKLAINIFRLIPAIIILLTSSAKKVIFFDTKRWMELERINSGLICAFGSLLVNQKEFRNLVIYRMRKQGFVGAYFMRLLFPPMETLYIISQSIGKGLYIQHGFSTIISAKSIGDNCFINQQVTIGFEGAHNPIIGNNVRICAGAKVIGDVHIGDGAIIGANAVVVKNIPPNTTAGGYQQGLFVNIMMA